MILFSTFFLGFSSPLLANISYIFQYMNGREILLIYQRRILFLLLRHHHLLLGMKHIAEQKVFKKIVHFKILSSELKGTKFSSDAAWFSNSRRKDEKKVWTQLYASLIMVREFADRISPHFWNFANSLRGIIFRGEIPLLTSKREMTNS